MNWTREQEQAIDEIREWLSKPGRSMISLSGPAGTGKSSILNEIKKYVPISTSWAALTGKAALRVRELANVPATTLHKQLYERPDQDDEGQLHFNKLKSPEGTHCLVVDECFAYDQPILTENGWERIGKIVNGKKQVNVWSRNPESGCLELKPVVRFLKKAAPNEMLYINASRNKSTRGARILKCTKTHKILTPHGYVRAGALSEGDALIVPCNDLQKGTTVAYIQGIKTYFPTTKRETNPSVYDIEVEDNHNYVAGNVVVSNCSMITPKIYRDLKTWGNQGVKILLVGDGYQLPPILTKQEEREYGSDFSVFQVVGGPTLSKVMRSGDDLVAIAERVRIEEELPDSAGSYEYIECSDPGFYAIESFLEDPQDHMLVTWTNSLRMETNRKLRKILGYKGKTPKRGEPILMCSNGKNALNGEFLVVDDISPGRNMGTVKTHYFTPKGGSEETSQLINMEGRKEYMDGFMPWIKDWHGYQELVGQSPDGEPVPITYGYVATAHKCVHPDTIVETPQGMMPISDLSREGGTIATPVGESEYDEFYENQKGRILKISTKDGYTLRVTPDHGVYVWDGSCYSVKRADTVKKGDVVQFALFPICDPSSLRAAPNPPSSDTLDVRTVQHSVPRCLDENLAEFLGLFVADGTLFDRGFRLVKRHPDVVRRFSELCLHLFGIVPSPCDIGGTPGVEVHSRFLEVWLRQFGGLNPHYKDIPDSVLRSPLKIQAAFLRGLFEDGTVNLKKGVCDHIGFSSVQERVTRLVHIMLLRFGIISCRKQRRGQYYLYIYGQNALKFNEEIGFVSSFKRQRCVVAGSEINYTIPLSLDERQTLRPFMTRSQWNNARSHGRISRDTARQIMPLVDERHAQLLHSKLSWHHTKVESVDEQDESVSMCVRVPAVGRFMQDGSPQSNCQGSQFRRVTIFLDEDDLHNPYFNKPTHLPDGKTMNFASRWIYTALSRAKERVTVFVGG